MAVTKKLGPSAFIPVYLHIVPDQWVEQVKANLYYATRRCFFMFVIRGERILFFGPNTNTNNILNQILDRIRIRIIFAFSE